MPAEFSFDHEGEELRFSKYTSKETGRIDVVVVPRFGFPVCPICLDPNPDEAEHVPPESLGGKVMTWTCKKCNNDFGTAEDKLRSFIDLETTAHIEATDGSVPGKRAAKVAFRSSEGRPSGMFIRSAATGVRRDPRHGVWQVEREAAGHGARTCVAVEARVPCCVLDQPGDPDDG